MEFAESTPGPRCGVENCRSKRYHVAADGFTYCYYGHKRDAGPVIDDTEFHAGIVYSQASKIQGEKPERQEVFLEGREAVLVYLQCFQLVLRKQVHWLVKIKGFPAELETVVHDLWALRLQILHAMIEDPDERRAHRMFSTRSQADDSDTERTSTAQGQANLRQRAPQLIESVAMCYLALILLRLPVCASDVRAWVLSDGFAYLNTIRDLPRDMTQKLPLTLRINFYPTIGPSKLEKLHITIMRLAWAFNGAFGMEFPRINHQLLLYHFVSELALPLDVFPYTTQLARFLSHTFTFPPRPARHTRVRTHQYPEIALVSTLLVATKLLHPLDSADVARHPRTLASPAAHVVDWAAWAGARERYGATATRHAHGTHTATVEADVFGMSGAQLDAYMDWFDRRWLGVGSAGWHDDEAAARPALAAWRSEAAVAFRRDLFRMFPLGEQRRKEEADDEGEAASGEEGGGRDAEGVGEYDEDTQARISRIGAVQGSLLPRRVVPDGEEAAALGVAAGAGGRSLLGPDGDAEAEDQGEILRPGARYKRYRSIDEVPEDGKALFHEAAALVGVTVAEVVTALFAMEKKVEKCLKEYDAAHRGADESGDAMEIQGEFGAGIATREN